MKTHLMMTLLIEDTFGEDASAENTFREDTDEKFSVSVIGKHYAADDDE